MCPGGTEYRFDRRVVERIRAVVPNVIEQRIRASVRGWSDTRHCGRCIAEHNALDVRFMPQRSSQLLRTVASRSSVHHCLGRVGCRHPGSCERPGIPSVRRAVVTRPWRPRLSLHLLIDAGLLPGTGLKRPAGASAGFGALTRSAASLRARCAGTRHRRGGSRPACARYCPLRASGPGPAACFASRDRRAPCSARRSGVR